jgi:hypothetical protein
MYISFVPLPSNLYAMPAPVVGKNVITRLSPEEAANPAQVLLQFFEFAHLHQAKEMLANLRNAIVAKKFVHQNYSREEDEVAYFFEKLEQLIEACFLLRAKD